MKNIFRRKRRYRYFLVPYTANLSQRVVQNVLLVKCYTFPSLQYLKTGIPDFRENDTFVPMCINEVSKDDFENYINK